MKIERAAFVALVAAMASCHGGPPKMVTAPVEPEPPPDAGAGDSGADDSKRISCDDDVRARKCNEFTCSTREGNTVHSECGVVRKKLRPSAFNRFLDCAKEKEDQLCSADSIEECLDFPEGRCIDSTTREPCETALRNCSARGGGRGRGMKISQSACQAVVSAAQPRYRASLIACLTENCDRQYIRNTCLIAR